MEASSNMGQPPPHDGKLSLVDSLLILAEQKRLVLGLPFLAACLAAVVSLLLPKFYTGTVQLLPPQQSPSIASALLGQASVLGTLSQASIGLKNPSDLYVGLLRSRTVSDAIIERFQLKHLYGEDLLDDTRKVLEKRTYVYAGRDGIISVEVEDQDPHRAAAMANAYVDELERLQLGLAVTDAAKRRLFFERQVRSAKENLVLAEHELRKVMERFGLVSLEGQTQATILATARLQGEITAREVQRAAMKSFATERNPELLRVESELSSLRTQLTRLMTGSGITSTSALVSVEKGPETAHEYFKTLRDVKYHEALFEALSKQYEIAKVEEAKSAALIQVVDPAIAPERRTRPRRTLIVLAAALIALLVSIPVAFARHWYHRTKDDPVLEAKFATLRALLYFRRPEQG